MPHKCRKCGSTFDDTGKVISRPSEIIKEAKTMPEDEKKRKREELNRIAGMVTKPIVARRDLKRERTAERAPEKFQEWYGRGFKGAAAEESKSQKEAAQLRAERRAAEAAGPTPEEIEAERLHSVKYQKQYQKRTSFTKGEQLFGRFWKRAEAEREATPPPPDDNQSPPPPGDQIQCQRCKRYYNRNSPRCPNCGRPNPVFRLPHNKVLCQCGENYDIGERECPKCGEPNQRYLLKRGERKCVQCGHIITDTTDDFCEKCGAYNPKVKKPQLSESIAFRISGRTYEILMYELAGVFCIFGLPLLGLPQMLYLGIILMVLIPFYTYLPGESEVLASRGEGVKTLGSAGAASLVLKSNVKLFSFILTVIQFTAVPVSRLIPLAISFVYYFGLPTSYRTSQPSQMIEAWLRLFVGVAIAIFFLMGFAGTSQGLTLAWMSAAFFCTSFPRQKEEKEPGVFRVELMAKGYQKVQSGTHTIGAGLFLIFMGIALFYSNIPFSTSNDMSIIFYAVYILSLLSGLTTGPEGRPAMGVLMIIMTLFVFSFMFTGVIGQAVFGYWWPQVYGFVDSAVEPLIPLWQQATAGVGDAWLLMTNPMQYYNIMMMRQQATQSVVKTGGTTLAIELIKFDIFTSLTGTLEPIEDPVIGSIELQNKGEFEANTITLSFISEWIQAESVSISEGSVTQEPCGSLSKLECSTPGVKNPAGSRGTCVWGPDIIYPDEIKMSTFAYARNQWGFADGNLAECELDGEAAGCYDSVNTTYKFGGDILKISANYSFDYNVNVSIPVEVINNDRYFQLLAARQITLQELTSQYSGGPVKATLWSQRQPIRNGESSLFVASVYNDGTGLLNEIENFDVKIPKELGIPDKISQSFRRTPPSGNEPDGCDVDITDTSTDYHIIHCQHTCGEGCIVKPGEFKRVSFLITPQYGAELIDRKTSLIIGLGSYEYTKSTSQSLTIANFPPH